LAGAGFAAAVFEATFEADPFAPAALAVLAEFDGISLLMFLEDLKGGFLEGADFTVAL
jgi:hypothetical protein